MGNILSRIQEIACKEGITIGAFERSIGASKAVLSRAIANGTDIQSKWIGIIVEKYPQYSTRWLLTGEGPMLRADGTPTISSTYSTDISMPSDTVILRLMDKIDEKDNIIKEKEAENKQLQSELRQKSEELAALKAQHPQYQDKKAHPSAIDAITEAFTSESLEISGEGFMPMKKSPSKKSSVGKM